MALIDDLLAADQAAEILHHVARATWAKAHDGAECPDKRMPRPEELGDWMLECLPEAHAEASKLLTDLYGQPTHWDRVRYNDSLTPAAIIIQPEPQPGMMAVQDSTGQWLGATIETLDAVHARWKAIPAAERPHHPLSPVVADWQENAPVNVEADRHLRAILPTSLRDAQRDHEKLPLALDRRTRLGPIQPEQGYLPGLEPPPSVVPPVPWLTLYDLTGSGPVQTRGRGAPLAQRIFVEVLTAVHVGDRDPEWITAPAITLRDLFDWCWPRYWDREKWNKQAREWGDWSGGYQRNKHLEPLRRALIELDNMRIEYDRYERRLIRVDDLPTTTTALDDPIRFHVRHLPSSNRGPMIERAATRRWGVVSAPTWRSTIRLAYLWDEAKRRNNNARVYATRPVVARGAGGVILGADGRPLRDRHGAVVTDWSDRRAVILGADGKPAGEGNPVAYGRNPAADRVPVLDPDDLIRLAYDANLIANRRKRLHLAREALREKETEGEVVIETDGEGWRIIEARPATLTRIRGNADPDTWQR